MSPPRAAPSTTPPDRSGAKAAPPPGRAHSLRRFAVVYGVFVLAYAALRPAFMAREPNPFPVLGNSLFYSLAEVMEAAYFSTSFIAFVGIILALVLAGVLGTRPTAFAPGTASSPARPGDRLPIALGMLLPGIVLALPHGPRVLVADAFHHGEKLIFQGRPIAEAYRSFLPFKPLLFMKAAGLVGYDDSVASYLVVHEFVQRSGYIAVCLLAVLVVRLVRGRTSLLPVLLFLLAYPLLAAGLRHRYWILDMERLLFFLLFLDAVLLSLARRRRWPLFLAGAFASLQFLASIEYAIFAACALTAHLGLLTLRDRREGLRAAAVAIAGALPVVGTLLATGQLLPLIRFASYTTRFPDLYGKPLLYSAGPPALGPASPAILLPVIAVWLALLWAAGVFVPRALIRRQLDDRSLWIYMLLLLSILMFKVGLGRSDLQHLYLPVLFATLFLLTLVLARPWSLPRPPRAVSAAGFALALTLVTLSGLRIPPVPAGFVFDPSPRVRAHIPATLGAELSALRALLEVTGSRSLFFFSDQPLYNYLLDLPYPLHTPTLHEILTDGMLTRETAAFVAWAPDLVIWKAEIWTGNIDGIRTPVRDYRLAAAILARYRPLAARDGWQILARDTTVIDPAALRARGFEPLAASALEETFDWGDMAYHIGRSGAVPDDFKRVTLTLPDDACCSYRQAGRALVRFSGRAGTHRYGLYPAMSPGYREAAWDPESVSCVRCADAARAGSK